MCIHIFWGLRWESSPAHHWWSRTHMTTDELRAIFTVCVKLGAAEGSGLAL